MTLPTENELGPNVVGGILKLPVDADWVGEIEIPEVDDDDNPIDPIPEDALLQWRFPGVAVPDGYEDVDGVPIWTAEVAPGGRLITWYIPKALVIPLAALEPETARLHIVEGDTDQLWDVWRVRNV